MYRHETQTDRTGNTERQDTCTGRRHRQTGHMQKRLAQFNIFIVPTSSSPVHKLLNNVK
jgi:hypothetical protein